MDKTTQLICRHCKGDHLSLQCPKKNKSYKTQTIKQTKKKLMVIIDNLPDNLSKKELVYLLNEWGPIGKIFLKKNRNYTQSATIEFLELINGEKAIYQLDRTKFDRYILSVKKLSF